MALSLKYFILVPVSISLAVLVTGCDDQVTQCQKLIQVVNVGNSLIDDKKGQQVVTSVQLAKDLEAIHKSLQELHLSDPKLQEFQKDYGKIFQNLSQSIAKASEALSAAKNAEPSAAGRAKLQKARNQIDTALTSAASIGQESDVLASKLGKYCR